MHDERPSPLLDADHHRLVRAALRLLGPAEAEDAVQDAYVRALESRADTLNVAQAWLLTVVRHLAIDRLRRRAWMQQWVARTKETDLARTANSPHSPHSAHSDGSAESAESAESEAALAQEVTRALHLIATHLSPTDGAALLLLEVFDFSHADLAQASGRTESSSRQQLRRALVRLRGRSATSRHERTAPGQDAAEEDVFTLYLQALRLRDPTVLWAMLRQSPIRSLTGARAPAAQASALGTPDVTSVSTKHDRRERTACGIVQAGGQFGLALTLDGVTLCVLPIGAETAAQAEAA